MKQTKSATEVSSRFKAFVENPELFQPQAHANGFSFPKMLVITNKKTQIIQHFDWGLIPSWSQNDAIKKNTLNAKIETLDQKPAFKDVLHNRCLIIANGFYEWQWLDTKGKQKIKFEIGLENEALFAFAGLYANWVDTATGKERQTVTIITTQANELVSKIHNIKQRMPIILQKEDEEKWLNNLPIANVAFPYQVPLVAKDVSQTYRLF